MPGGGPAGRHLRGQGDLLFTHDSVGLGEDGPTHQPIEHVMSLRAIPGLRVIRPADANETAAAWRVAIEHNGPTALILSAPGPAGPRRTLPARAVDRGAYVLVAGRRRPDVVLVGTGSEVSVCVAAAAALADDGVRRERGVDAVAGSCSPSSPSRTRTRCCRRTCPRSPSRPAPRSAGTRWADEAVGIDASERRRPGARSWRSIGFTAENVAARARAGSSPISRRRKR